MEQNNQYCREIEIKIDLKKYVEVIIKRKKVFAATVLFILATGLIYFIFGPKVYRISVLFQPPVNLEPAENLRVSIINNAFNDALIKKMGLEQGFKPPAFDAEIVDKSNILRIGIDIEGNKKEFGVKVFKNLAAIISESYGKRIETEIAKLDSLIKFYERAIANANEKAQALREQIIEMSKNERKLIEEKERINSNTARILDRLEWLLRDNAAAKANTLSLALKINFTYLNWLNDELNQLPQSKTKLILKLKDTNEQLNNFSLKRDQLRIDKGSLPRFNIISEPRVSPKPVNRVKKKVLYLYLTIAIFFGMFAAFLQEFLASDLVKKWLKKR